MSETQPTNAMSEKLDALLARIDALEKRVAALENRDRPIRGAARSPYEPRKLSIQNQPRRPNK